MTMYYPIRILLAAATLVAASSAHADSITLSNGNFETTVGGGAPTGDNPLGWSTTEYNNGIYVFAAANGGFGNVFHFKEGRGSDSTLFLTQDLSSFNTGLTATAYDTYTITLDLGWRTNTAGADATLRFALVNLTEGNTVLGYTDYTLLKGATVNNSYTLRNDDMTINIAYNNMSGNLVGDSIGLKIARTDVNDAGNDNASVVWMDNVSVTAVPESSAYGLMGGGALAAVAFFRRRQKSS